MGAGWSVGYVGELEGGQDGVCWRGKNCIGVKSIQAVLDGMPAAAENVGLIACLGCGVRGIFFFWLGNSGHLPALCHLGR